MWDLYLYLRDRIRHEREPRSWQFDRTHGTETARWTLARIDARFGDGAATIHSGLSAGQRCRVHEAAARE